MTDFNDPSTIHHRIESLKDMVAFYAKEKREIEAKLKEAKRVYDKAIMDRIKQEKLTA